jgi:thiamine biosynthesis lipoprotein
MRCAFLLTLGLGVLLSAVGCTRPDDGVRISGPTMGTVYNVRAYCQAPVPDLEARIEAALAEIDGEMSNWRSDSTLSRFNAAPIGEWFPVSASLAVVVSAAQSLAERSGGAFDVTVGPLVDAWGFGPDAAARARAAPPDEAAVEAARARVGYTFLDVRSAPPALRRRRDLEVDLSAIAPGHATDVLSELLTQAGCPDHMVDVGGEVYARGRKADGSAWRIGIETPDPARPPGTSVSRVLRLGNMAVSTSGDYRDFIEWQGHRYSHTFDPRTGAPVDHALASVTVLDRSTMWADGIATLLTVLGPTAGFEFADAGGIPALFIERRESGFVERMTAPFADYLEGPSS